MSLINVQRDNPDPFYRYKMERIQTKIEGKGNGIKTVVVNLSSVAQSLARPGAYLIKYFGFELGAQTNIDPADDRWIINGAHEASKLQELLDGFIKNFVLCKPCKNPETVVNISDGQITLDCKACGRITKVLPSWKLSGFILKNQPKKGKKDKAERKAARKAKQNGKNGDQNGSGGDENSDQASPNGDIASDDDELTRKIKTEAQSLEIKEVEVNDDDWAVDMSAEAVKARAQQLPGEFKTKLAINGDDDDEDGEGGGSTVYDQLGTFILEHAEEQGGIDKVDDIAIYVKAKELGIEAKHRTIMVLVQTIFDENILAQIPKHIGIMKKVRLNHIQSVCRDGQLTLNQLVTSEKHEKALLGGTERLIGQLGSEKPDMFTKVTKILQLYYAHDLISEEVVTKWGSKASKRYVDIATSKKVRKAAEPFLTWLAEAESESEEESDDE